MIADATGLEISSGINDHVNSEGSEIRVSGSLESHYSPLATVLLDQHPIAGQGFIALADVPTPEGVIRLASPKDDEEFARVLYSSLRAADEQSLTHVVVTQPQGDGIAIAIRDRLKRSANEQ
jgi:L-threonylcarbamoyladenylate synthase